jgi:arylformamidase
MNAETDYQGRRYVADLRKPIDISIPVCPRGVSAWFVGQAEFVAVRGEAFIGSVKEGGAVNFRDIRFNPHAHGTHTESRGHISAELYSVNSDLQSFFFVALLITVDPARKGGDQVITRDQLAQYLGSHRPEALVIRTVPNSSDKTERNYSGTNFPYLGAEAMDFVVNSGVQHLLIDLPSVDREQDNGALLAHRRFWDDPNGARDGCTITELIFVRDDVPDGLYLLNLQVAPFENDAAPSRPVLFSLGESTRGDQDFQTGREK